MEEEGVSINCRGESEDGSTEDSMRSVLMRSLPRRGRYNTPIAVQDTPCFRGKIPEVTFGKGKQTLPRSLSLSPLLPCNSYHHSPHIKGSVYFGTMQPKELPSLGPLDQNTLSSDTEAVRKLKGGRFSKTTRFKYGTVSEGIGSFSQERKADDELKYKGFFGTEERFFLGVDEVLHIPGPGDYKVPTIPIRK